MPIEERHGAQQSASLELSRVASEEKRNKQVFERKQQEHIAFEQSVQQLLEDTTAESHKRRIALLIEAVDRLASRRAVRRVMTMRRLFVTVGSTEFDDLIAAVCVDDVLELLAQKGFTHILLQIGRGNVTPARGRHNSSGIDIDFYQYKPSIADDITLADLVIGHCGAGTTIQVLNARKPLIVVVNEALHDNHQLELAHQLAQDHHLVYCTPSTLCNTLRTFDESELRPWQPGQPQRFARWLNAFVTGEN